MPFNSGENGRSGGLRVRGLHVRGLHVRGGVETLTIEGGDPGARYLVSEAGGRPVVTVVADADGGAHLAFVPREHRCIASADDLVALLPDAEPPRPGRYTVVEVGADGDPVGHDPHRATVSSEAMTPHEVVVLAVDDLPDPTFYEQELNPGFGYLTVRDGTRLSINVRFPDEGLYGPGPYPTVVEYSGYSPSHPTDPQPSTLLATLMGFAVVGVNLRGTGCSGGVFDVFSPAQAADGYDVIETVARQPWVLHGHVGMVGLSYPGVMQLYVAARRPPHLAAIAPLSVIDCPWRQQWPGGIYNSGFTRAWIAMRDQAARAGGMAWDQERVDNGDEIAKDNLRLRRHNLDFERFGRVTDTMLPFLEARNLAGQVDRIEVPVYLTGAWQDEQTGSRFAHLIGDLSAATALRATLFNGHHPDGYSPAVVLRWFEFLSLHVARRVPRVHELLRSLAPLQFAEVFGFVTELEADRFDRFGDDVDAALAAYWNEPPIRLLFESGAGHETLGAAAPRYEVGVDSFPPADVVPMTWYLTEGGLVADRPEAGGRLTYSDDPDAGRLAYAKELLLVDLNRFTRPTPELPSDWTRFREQHRVVVESAVLDRHLGIAGNAHVDLWLAPGTTDTAVQVTLTEIRPDGLETRVQSGWHRPVHRAEDPAASDALRVEYTFHASDRSPLEPGEWIRFRVPFAPVCHVFRAGSRVRLTISTPGRDHPFWCFDAPVRAGSTHEVGWGGGRASALVVPFWPGAPEPPRDHPAAGALRGQPTRSA